MRNWPGRFDTDDLADATALDSAGLGLDSVEIAEVLLACEEASGVTLPATVLSGGPLTVARVSACFWGTA
jgi:acyl carrier protein